MRIKRNKTIKYRAYPSKQQETQIRKTIGCTRKIWNLMLSDRNEHYQVTREIIHPSPAQYKKQEEYEYLKEVDSLALANAQQHLETAFKNYYEGRAELPNYKSKHHSKASYTTNNVNNSIRFKSQEDQSRLRLPKLGFIKIKQSRTAPLDWRIKAATIELTPSGRITITVLFEYEDQVPDPRPVNSILGLDYSSPCLYVDSNGMKPGYPRYYRKYEAQLAREQARLSHMVKGSANYVKQKQRVARVHEKIRNSRLDHHCKLVREIIREYDTVVIEDLDLQAMSQSLHLGKSTMDNGFGIFRGLLARALEESGGRLIIVDKFFPSSQLCSNCGFKNTGVKDLAVREWVCPGCGVTHDRDMNAALNLKREGERLLGLTLSNHPEPAGGRG